MVESETTSYCDREMTDVEWEDEYEISSLSTQPNRRSEPNGSIAYYYGDLERIKSRRRRCSESEIQSQPCDNKPNYKSLELNSAHVPILVDGGRKNPETYSTAGTFPLPQFKEKEPLLAELEVVGRIPLTQFEGSGVTRSRSWYLCCPVTNDEELSRESSWRYSSLRPITAPPGHARRSFGAMGMGLPSNHESSITLRQERDMLKRELENERALAESVARAHDARLAELHGVIAELVRRRQGNKPSIPEDDERDYCSEACESSTQPVGEADPELEHSRTDQNDSSSVVSPKGQQNETEQKLHTETSDYIGRSESINTDQESENIDHCLDSGQGVDIKDLSEQTGRCQCDELYISENSLLTSAERTSGVLTQTAVNKINHHKNRPHDDTLDVVNLSCHGGQPIKNSSVINAGRYSPCSGLHDLRYIKNSSPVEPRVASRVRLRRVSEQQMVDLEDDNRHRVMSTDLVEKVTSDLITRSGYEEAVLSGNTQAAAALAVAAAKCDKLEADVMYLQVTLDQAKDTLERVSMVNSQHESVSVELCEALRCADRALEAYDVLLALSEAKHATQHEREVAESIAAKLLSRLESEAAGERLSLEDPMMPAGPWLHNNGLDEERGGWGPHSEDRLRGHAARLKADTVTLRCSPPHLYSFSSHEEELHREGKSRSLQLEAALMMQEVTALRLEKALCLLENTKLD